jgi:hypothetical protein
LLVARRMQQLESEERESSVLAGWSTPSTHVMLKHRRGQVTVT